VLTLLLLLPSAPAPKKKPPVEAMPAAVCTMTWGATEYRAVFSPPRRGGWGLYEARGADTLYLGRWRLRRGVLTVEERQAGGEGYPFRWRGRLRRSGGALAGTLRDVANGPYGTKADVTIRKRD
jgi:hypothetical protein